MQFTQPGGIAVEQRFAELLAGEFFTPDYVFSPYESDPSITLWPGNVPVTSSHYSYAMLQVPLSGGRNSEWRQTLNAQAVILSDRNTGTATSTYGLRNSDSVSSSTFGCTNRSRQPYLKLGHWVGDVLWNDNHVEFLDIDNPDTRYDSVLTPGDRLFESSTKDDAFLIHTGN